MFYDRQSNQILRWAYLDNIIIVGSRKQCNDGALCYMIVNPHDTHYIRVIHSPMRPLVKYINSEFYRRVDELDACTNKETNDGLGK